MIHRVLRPNHRVLQSGPAVTSAVRPPVGSPFIFVKKENNGSSRVVSEETSSR
jgi:hypothetical protein